MKKNVSTKVNHPRPIRRSPTNRIKETPLSKDDWVEAATEMLVEENHRGIRIDNLCKRLGVTKGSFYWHFGGRPDLLSSILEKWRKRMTTNIIERLSALGNNPTERLRALFELPARPRSSNFAHVEQSVRDWGRNTDQAHDAVKEVDRLRLAYFETLLKQHGLSEKTAQRRAYIAYSIMMGDSILRVTLGSKSREDAVTEEVMKILTQ